ncbi:hypothetical protein BDC45DRAFT_536664 [Circinella umbellata]|nr:hypothetical protein BDC45DRAFT_536664 [Circinella umbellata]
MSVDSGLALLLLRLLGCKQVCRKLVIEPVGRSQRSRVSGTSISPSIPLASPCSCCYSIPARVLEMLLLFFLLLVALVVYQVVLSGVLLTLSILVVFDTYYP